MAPKPDFDALVAELNAALKSSTKTDSEVDVLMLAADGTPDWLWEILHPKGLDGKFIKKGAGSYIYGHAKTATFDAGKAAHGPSKPKDVTLEPGESLYQTPAGTVFRLNENGQAKVWNSTQNAWASFWKSPPVHTGVDNWIDYFKGDVTLLDKNEPEYDVKASSLEKAEAVVKGGLEALAPSTTPEFVFSWTKTKVMDALTQKTSKGVSNYLYAQSSFYNPKTEGDAADNKKSFAQRDALTRLAMAYQDSGYLSAPSEVGANYANFLLQNDQPEGGYSVENSLAMVDAMEALADFIDMQESEVDLRPIKASSALGSDTQKNYSPQDYLREYAKGFRAKIAESAPVAAPEAPKAVEPALDTSEAVDTPDVAGKKPADASVITTKAGPPYGPNVWVTPGYTDADGNPFLMSSQGEKNAYAVFVPGTPPAIVKNSKGEDFDGVSDSGLLHVAVNKKSAKAWLAQNHADAAVSTETDSEPDFVPESGLADWEKELMSAAFEEEAAAVDAPGPVKTVADLPEIFKGKAAEFPDKELWYIVTANTGIQALAVKEPGSKEAQGWTPSLSTDDTLFEYEIPSFEQSTGWTLVQSPKPEKPKPSNPSVDVKFTKVSKDADGTITWKVLGAKDANGDDYTVLSGGGNFAVLSSSGEVLGDFNSAKAAKAWIAEQSASEAAPVEELAPTEPLPEWAVDNGLKTAPASVLAKVKPLQSGDAQGSAHYVIFDDENPDLAITYGIDADGVIVASDMPTGSAYMGKPLTEMMESLGTYGMEVFYVGTNSNYVEPPEKPAVPDFLSGLPQEDFSVPPGLPFGNFTNAKFFVKGDNGHGAEFYAALDENGDIIGGSSTLFNGTSKMQPTMFPSLNWTLNPKGYGEVTFGAISYPDDTPDWVKEDGIPFIPMKQPAMPFGTKHSVATKGGQLIGIDGEGYVTYPDNIKDDSIGVHADKIVVYYGAVGETKPNPFETPVVSDPSLPSTEETEADNLPTEAESPSESNPTPGDPKAHLAVPVVGVKGKPGTYLTKKLKDEHGKPYTITSNGKPNNWEVFDSEDKHLGTFKQLKDAKAWLATDGASDEPAVTPQEGGYFTFSHKGVTVNVFPGSFVLESESAMGEKAYYVVTPGEYYVKAYLPSKESVHDIYDSTGQYSNPKKVAAKGAKVIYGSLPSKPIDIWKTASTDFGTPAKKFDAGEYHVPYYKSKATIASEWNATVTAEANAAIENAHSGKGLGKAMHSNHTLSDEQVSEAYAAGLKELQKFDWAGAKAYLESERDKVSGSDKTKWTKALARFQHDVYVMDLVRKISDGSATGADYLNSRFLGDAQFPGDDWTLPYVEDNLIAGVRANLQRIYRKENAQALGINPDWVENTGDVNIPADEVVAVRNMLAEKFDPNLAYLTDAQVSSYVRFVINNDTGSAFNLTKAAAKQVTLAKSVQMVKDWKAAQVAGEAPKPISESSEDVLAALDFSNANIAAAKPLTSAGTSDTVKVGDTVYTFGPFTGKWYDVHNPENPKITTEAMGFLIQTGLAKPESTDTVLVEGDPSGLPLFAVGDNAVAQWAPPKTEYAALLTDKTLYGATDAKNPVLLSLIDVPSNPHTALKDNEFVWKSLYAKVAAEMPNLLSGDADSYPYSQYVSTFGLGNAYDNSDNPLFQQKSVKEWVADTVVPHLEKFAPTSTPAAITYTDLSAPAGIDEDQWNIALAAANGINLPVFEHTTSSSYVESYPSSVDQTLKTYGGALDNMPESAKKWYATGAQGNIGNLTSNTAAEILVHLMKSGIWTPKEGKTTTTIEYHGHKHTLDVFPGDKIWKGSTNYGDNVYLLQKPDGTVYQLGYSSYSGSGTASVTSVLKGDWVDADGTPTTAMGYQNWEEYYFSPVDFDYEFTKTKIGDYDKATFDIFTDAFMSGKKSFADVDLPNFSSVTQGDSLIYMKKVLSDNKDNADWAALAKVWNEISPAGKKALHWAHANGNDILPQLATLASKYQMFKAGSSASVIDKNAIYFDLVSKGKVTLSDIQNSWSAPQEQQAAHDLLGVAFNEYWNDVSKYRQELADFLSNKNNGGTAEKKNTPASMADSLVLHPASFSLGGMHTKGTWADEDGNKWLSKAFSSDPNSLARIEAEHYAMRIGALYGFNPPATGIMTTPDGKKSYVQHYADAAGNLEGFSWNDLSEGALHSTMEQHVLDWIISNHDSHSGNILRTVDGSSTYPIDRGQAFKFLGKDKLAVGYLPPGNGAPVYYDHVYNSIMSGSISKEKADAIRDAVLRKAAIITARNDDEYRDFVTKALANRTQLPTGFSSTSAMVDYLMERKASTFNDFVGLWGKVYKSAGYDFGTHTIDNYLPKKVGSAHVSVTPDFASDVMNSSSAGVPLFFAGTEVDNGHAQFFVTNNKTGGKTLRANFKLMSDADDVLQNWLSTQTIEKKSGSAHIPAAPVVPNHSVLPGLVTSHMYLVQFVKTVGSHIKSGDYQWNGSTVSQAETTMNQLEDGIAKVKEHILSAPNVPYPEQVMPGQSNDKFKTVEQQDAWLSQAEKMLENFKIVKNAMDTKVSVTQTHPDLVPFKEPTYTPSSWIDPADLDGITSQYVYNGETWTKYKNGAMTKKSASADAPEWKVEKSEFDNAAAHGFLQSLGGEDPADVPVEDTEATVTAGTQIIKVTHKAASAYNGTMDLNTLEVTESSESTKGVHGYEYVIEVDDIRMRFQSRKDVSIDSQKSLLRLEIDSWTGDTQQIEKALTALRSMGLELNEADEQELELLYWRQLRATLNKRKLDDKWKGVQSQLNGISASMNTAEEIAAYRAAFSSGYGNDTITDFVNSKGYRPQVGTFFGNGDVKNGRPWWYRPDMDIAKLKKAHNGTLLRHSLYDTDVHESVGKTGFLPTEERLRVLGKWVGGMSSESDQGHGSSSYLFFRQNQSLSINSLYLEPTEFFRTSNYGFTGDEFGDAALKSSTSPFDLWKTTGWKGGSNETLVKNGISLLDGMAVIVVYGEAQRQKIIEHYKAMGVTEIRGIPVEERVVTSTSQAQATINKVWDYWINKQNAGEMPWATTV